MKGKMNNVVRINNIATGEQRDKNTIEKARKKGENKDE